METIISADLPLPPPLVRRGYCAEYKLMKLRECALPDRCALDTPDKAYEFWTANVITAPWYRDEQESFVVLLLSTRKRCTGFSLVTIGLLDQVYVHAREVFRPAIVGSASAIIIAHNHPSGDPTPSESDIKVTRDLVRAGQLLKIDLLDHLIVGSASPERTKPWISLRELGYLYS